MSKRRDGGLFNPQSTIRIPHFDCGGQAVLEYLLFFTVIALVCVFAVGLLPQARQTVEQHVSTAVQRITKP